MHPPPSPNPLILTLTLDKSSQTFLTNLRSKYFPPTRNFLTAHITLFHALPAHRLPELQTHLSTLSSRTKSWTVFITDPVKMGNSGVMVNIKERPYGTFEAVHWDILCALRKGVRGEGDELSAQDDRRVRKAHVTVLNKAKGEEEVERCLEEVKAVFEGLREGEGGYAQKRGRVIGFEVWEYLGGPWKHLQAFYFDGVDPSEGGGQPQ